MQHVPAAIYYSHPERAVSNGIPSMIIHSIFCLRGP